MGGHNTPSPFSLSLLLTLSLPFLTSAQNRFGTPDIAPWAIPLPTWNRTLDNSASLNATGEFTIQAPNTTIPFPALNQSTQSWSWKVSVVADFPLTESREPSSVANSSKTFTASRIVLQRPNGTGASFHDSWNLCVIQWRVEASKFPARLRGDDGSCGSVLSEQCIRAVEQNAIERYGNSSDIARSPCRCPNLAEVAGCEGGQAEFMSGVGSCSARTFSASAVRDWPDGRFEVQRYGGLAHDRGNLTGYNETGSLAWPVMLLWGSSARSVDPFMGVVETRDTRAKMSCVRANQAVNGGSVPGVPVNATTNGTSSENAGFRSRDSSLVTLVSGLVLAGAWVAFW